MFVKQEQGREQMTTIDRYVLPVESTGWNFDGKTEIAFVWEYDDEREKLLQLYDKGKKQQWDAAERIDWSIDLDPENPMEIDDRIVPIYGTDIWNRMTDKEKTQTRIHQQAAQISQFLHGEQGALIATSKIVATVPHLDAKFYAATQVMDEARHVEAYNRLLHEKMELAYPMTPGLKTLLEQGLTDSRWDMTYLTMQVLIEGLALAAFQRIRDYSTNPLAAAVNAYVMQDEARHVAFGRLSLRDFYPELTQSERDEREEFVVEACYHMRDRFNQMEVWEQLGLPARECAAAVMESQHMAQFRQRLFSRVVPIVKDIGLWGPRVQSAFAEMGAIQFADVNTEEMLENDSKVADEHDLKMFVEREAGPLPSQAAAG
jgi:1,2-phenylacetyl-CoA epoxidase catalytic subunit